MEIEPEYFPPLPTRLLSKDPNCLTFDKATTKKIYQELLFRLEEWFKMRDQQDQISFYRELISLTRLVDKLDICQLLTLCEFILKIVV